MKKVNQIGKRLSKKEQKLIVGGTGAIVDCPPFSIHYPHLPITCDENEEALTNSAGGSVKCCHRIHDCCYGKRCDGSTFEVGAGCAYRSQMQVSFVR